MRAPAEKQRQEEKQRTYGIKHHSPQKQLRFEHQPDPQRNFGNHAAGAYASRADQHGLSIFNGKDHGVAAAAAACTAQNGLTVHGNTRPALYGRGAGTGHPVLLPVSPYGTLRRREKRKTARLLYGGILLSSGPNRQNTAVAEQAEQLIIRKHGGNSRQTFLQLGIEQLRGFSAGKLHPPDGKIAPGAEGQIDAGLRDADRVRGIGQLPRTLKQQAFFSFPQADQLPGI